MLNRSSGRPLHRRSTQHGRSPRSTGDASTPAAAKAGAGSCRSTPVLLFAGCWSVAGRRSVGVWSVCSPRGAAKAAPWAAPTRVNGDEDGQSVGTEVGP